MERIWDPGGGWIQRNLRDRERQTEAQKLTSVPQADPRTARPDMVVYSLLAGVLWGEAGGGGWGVFLRYYS